MNNLEKYNDQLSNICFERINEKLSGKTAECLFRENFENRINSEKTTRKHFIEFQKYYFKLMDNPEEIQFNIFKQKYSLQGVTSEYLDNLNIKKREIIELIKEDNLADLYFKHFHHKCIISGNPKSFGSFFTKVVHTFKPYDYTPVDMPMKEYFKLNNESYFVSMLVISNAFKKWANENRNTVDEFNRLLVNYMNENHSLSIDKSQVTDIKVMDTIFWSIANHTIAPI